MTQLLEVNNLTKHFALRSGVFRRVGTVKAVDGVSFSVPPKKTFGLAGETGCGKTTLAKCILRIIQPTSGEVMVEGKNIFTLSGKELKVARRNVQAIFQNPLMSLDPRMTASNIIAEPLKTHHVLPKAKMDDRIIELMRTVGLDEEQSLKYPHELSGGQNQRVAIARALSLNPRLILLDEPTSSLDVSVQAQILNLLTEIQRKSGLGYLFISHDLSVLRYFSDFLAIMYLGRIVELGPSDVVFKNPSHPYTQLLLSAIPDLSASITSSEIKVSALAEVLESPPENGCKFYPRCPVRMEKCKTTDPTLFQVESEHHAACLLFDNRPSLFYSAPKA